MPGAKRKRNGIKPDIERGIGEMTRKDCVDQLAHATAAIAVRERHMRSSIIAAGL